MYAQAGNRENSDYVGVEVYTSKDLRNWQSPKPVLRLPDDIGIKAVWAPEVHEYRGSFYLFVTLTFNRTLGDNKPVRNAKWPSLLERGTYIYRSDSPVGPFSPLREAALTPSDWMAIDGSLYREGGTPYMLFCHEWIQLVDGAMNVVQLTDDLSGTVGKPRVLFKASDVPGAENDPKSRTVAHGSFAYRSQSSGKLFIIWATFLPEHGHCLVASTSQSGQIKGPWMGHNVLLKKTGGHGMFFRKFDGSLKMALHQPSGGANERLRIYDVIDSGENLEIIE